MHVRSAATILIVALVCLVGTEARSEGEWATFSSKEGRFSVEMPGQPVKTETHEDSFIGTISNLIYTAEAGQDQFVVDYSDIPHFALHFAGADTIYDHAKGALLKKTFSKPTSYTDVTVGGHAGKRLVYDTPPKDGHPEMRGDAILLLVDARLYVVDAVVPVTEADAKSKRFLSSLAIQK